MLRESQIFIEGRRLDLFKDEQVNINSSIQSIADISKVFTDYTQSFTVPASDNNNEIFQHFYNSEVILRDNEFLDHQIKRNAYIELDGAIFRRGKMALEKSIIKEGYIDSYQITFYGELTTLKDKFGEKKMNELDWTAFSHEFTYPEVKARVEDGSTDYDVRYPLISSERYWQYDNPDLPDENIDTTGGAIDYTELFPALKLRRIFETFETEFDITFTGGWKDDPRFDRAYGLFNNTKTSDYSTPAQPIGFAVLQTQFPTFPPVPIIYNPDVLDFWLQDNTTNDGYITINTGEGSITLRYLEYLNTFNNITDEGVHTVQIITSNSTPNDIEYYIDVYKNGILLSTEVLEGNVTAPILEVDNAGIPSLDDTYTFQFRSSAPISIDIQLKYFFYIPVGVFGSGFIEFGTVNIFAYSINTSGDINLAVNAPDATVERYFADVLKMFNLTCYSLVEGEYVIDTLEVWYNEGSIIDITEYTDERKIAIDRIKLYKKIAFEYKESKSILNETFKANFFRDYGDLEAIYNYEGGEYKVGLIFENLLMNKFTDTNLQVGYLLDQNLNSYNSNPIILYMADELDTSFYLTDGVATTDELTTYMPFGQDTYVNNYWYSLNWGAEISTLLDQINPNGLYSTYYRNYIENLYNFRNRQVTVKCKLPVWILAQLELNDRLVIRDKRYIIDNFKLNLTTGEANLVLLLDFREILASGGGIQLEEVDDINPNGGGSTCFQYYVQFYKGTEQVDLAQCVTTTPSVTITPSTLTQSGWVEICVPDNPTPITSIETEQNIPPTGGNSALVISELGNVFTQEIGQPQYTQICLTYTEISGTSQNILYVSQNGITEQP